MPAKSTLDSCRLLPLWAMARMPKVFVYFDNDVKVHAPFDAMALAHRLGVRSIT